MSTTMDRVAEFVAPLATELGLAVYDIDFAGGTLRVLLETGSEGGPVDGGVDVDRLTEASRRVSRWLDESEVVPGSYTLEVSSPGLERNLRTPQHFAGAVGESVKIKLKPGVDGDRRVDGQLTGADDTSATVLGADGSSRSVHLDDIERARTHFEWGPAPKPGQKPGPKTQKTDQKKGRTGGTGAKSKRGAAPPTTGRSDDAMASTDREHATNSEALQ